MKNKITLSILLVTLIWFPSCKKCQTCTEYTIVTQKFKDKSTNLITLADPDTTKATPLEICGSNDIKDNEEVKTTTKESYNPPPYDVTIVETTIKYSICQ